MDRRIADPLRQQREVPCHFPQHFVKPAVTHHHLHQVCGGLDLARPSKRLEFDGPFVIVRRQLLQETVKCRVRVFKWQAHRGRFSDRKVFDRTLSLPFF